MAHGSRFTRCTAQREDESFCDAETVPDAPFPICVHHLAQVAEFLASVATGGLGGLRMAADALDLRAARQEAASYDPVVYYLRVGAMVKIGHTGRLAQRMKAFPPHAVLLATEPGGLDLEMSRHREHRASRAVGREWYHPSAALIEHINSLREQPLTAAELAV